MRLAAPWTGTWAEPLFGPPLEIVAILLIGTLARWLLHRVIDRAAAGIAIGSAELGRLDARLSSTTSAQSTAAAERRRQRARTTASVLKSLTTAVIGSIVVITVLDVMRIPVAPLLASAGIAGVALGFGAQSLVRDVISGLFMMVEDQYGVGDSVDLGDAVGTVEAVGLRVTRLLADDGTVWYVRNGEIRRVANASQGWSRATLDVTIPYGQNVSRAEQVLLREATVVRQDPAHAARFLTDPALAGVEQLAPGGIVVRVSARTAAGAAPEVASAWRARVVSAFEAEGIALATGPNAPCAPRSAEDRSE